MDKKLQISPSFKKIMILLIVIGVATVAAGFLTGETSRTWANLLLNNYFFLSITLGGLFWLALQAITQSGWSAGFLRVPQALVSYLLVAAILWLFLFIGIPHLFHWAQPDVMAHDPVLAHKAPYLNVPFLIIRTVAFFLLWLFISSRIRKLSLKEDQIGGLDSFNKIEFLSKIFIFVLGISFVFVGIDWLMSLDAHWYSTLFSVKFFVSSFYHGSAVIVAVVIILHKLGYFPFLNKGHLHDFSKYIFMLSIMWGYMWFVQYLLIWYGNIPEETVYFHMRREEGFHALFLAEIFINWLFPFLFLMWNRLAKNAHALLITVAVLLVGQYVEIYNAVAAETVHKVVFGYLEIGTFIGFAGLFLLVGALSLAKYPLVAKNHPYLMESFVLEDFEDKY
jgi:hypothetical protein